MNTTFPRRRLLKNLTLVAALVAALGSPATVRADDWKPEEGFTSLFNGKDLTGWGYRDKDAKVLENFDGKLSASDGRYTAREGMLVVNPFAEGKGPKLRQLWSTPEFPKNFILKLEFRAAVNADSGIFLRKPQSLQKSQAVQGAGLEQNRGRREGQRRALHVQRRGARGRAQAARHRPHRPRSGSRRDGLSPHSNQGIALSRG